MDSRSNEYLESAIRRLLAARDADDLSAELLARDAYLDLARFINSMWVDVT